MAQNSNSSIVLAAVVLGAALVASAMLVRGPLQKGVAELAALSEGLAVFFSQERACSVVDFGCGLGDHAARLRLVRPLRLQVVDHPPRAALHCRRRVLPHAAGKRDQR